MEAVFRKAVPADAARAVPLIYSSGPDAFEYVFGGTPSGSALEFLHNAFGKQHGEMGNACHMVAEVAGEVVGIGAGFGAGSHTANTLAIGRQILSFYGPWRAAGVMRRGLRFERMVRPPSAGEYALVHIGVDRAYWGKGIGRALMEHLADQARQAGYTRAILDVAVTNPRACRLYEGLGFRKTSRNLSGLARHGITVPDHDRMELVL